MHYFFPTPILHLAPATSDKFKKQQILDSFIVLECLPWSSCILPLQLIEDKMTAVRKKKEPLFPWTSFSTPQSLFPTMTVLNYI